MVLYASSMVFGICIVQFIIIFYLVTSRHSIESTAAHAKISASGSNCPTTAVQLSSPPLPLSTAGTQSSTNPTPAAQKQYRGVAVTLFLHSPTWFQKRYSVMVHNIRSNIPDDWAIQIFYTAEGQSQNAIDINKGLQRMIEKGDVLLTLIPPHVAKVKRKYYEAWTDRWIWSNMVAPRVLVFGGNAAICSNSPFTVDTFQQWDYIGGPWDFKKGVGGDGGISLRNRDAMVAVIDYATSLAPTKEEKDTVYKSFGQEDTFFVSRMLEMNKKGLSNFSLATRAATLQFSAIGGAVNDQVFVASGILPVVPYDDRERFLTLCPELKTLFPALHDPSCFGASPNATRCAQSICALKVPRRKGGC